MQAKHGHFFWNERMSWDVEKTKSFYAASLGWTFEPMPMEDGGTYWVAKTGDQAVAGLFTMTQAQCGDSPEAWLGYICVEDVDARSQKAVAAGATLMRPIFHIPNVGRIALLTEPGGAAIGWITPEMPPMDAPACA